MGRFGDRAANFFGQCRCARWIDKIVRAAHNRCPLFSGGGQRRPPAASPLGPQAIALVTADATAVTARWPVLVLVKASRLALAGQARYENGASL